MGLKLAGSCCQSAPAQPAWLRSSPFSPCPGTPPSSWRPWPGPSPTTSPSSWSERLGSARLPPSSSLRKKPGGDWRLSTWTKSRTLLTSWEASSRPPWRDLYTSWEKCSPQCSARHSPVGKTSSSSATSSSPLERVEAESEDCRGDGQVLFLFNIWTKSSTALSP